MLWKQSGEDRAGRLPSLCCSSRCGCETGLSGFRYSRPVVFCFFPLLRPPPTKPSQWDGWKEVPSSRSFPFLLTRANWSRRCGKNCGTWNKSATRDTEASSTLFTVSAWWAEGSTRRLEVEIRDKKEIKDKRCRNRVLHSAVVLRRAVPRLHSH